MPRDEHITDHDAPVWNAAISAAIEIVRDGRERPAEIIERRLSGLVRPVLSEEQERVAGERIAVAFLRADRCVKALHLIVELIDAAGALNLARGVKLGQTSWYVKMTDALEAAREALAKTEA